VLSPPLPLIPVRVVFGVVNGAERHGELIAPFEPKPARLRPRTVATSSTVDNAFAA
jgi:hypothetical protein